MDKQVEETTERTREAIQRVLAAKLAETKVGPAKTAPEDASYVRYTPTAGLLLESGQDQPKKQRVIKIVDKKEDPLLPSKFKIRKTPDGPSDEPPAPILHKESSVKLTKQDQKRWTIPPAISNWKNTKGFTIAIDKRLAGMGQADPSQYEMSDKFALLNDALDAANQEAKQELQEKAEKKREEEQKRLLQSQEKLRLMARRARAREPKGRGGRKSSDRDLVRSGANREVERFGRLQRNEAPRSGAQQPEAYDSGLYLKAAGTNAHRSEGQVYDRPLFGSEDAVEDIYRARTSDKYHGLGAAEASEETLSGPVAFDKGETEQTGQKGGLKSLKRQWEE